MVAEHLIAPFNEKIKFLKENENSYPIVTGVDNHIIENIEQTLELIRGVANKTINIDGYDDEQILKSLNIFHKNTIYFLKSNTISSNFEELLLLLKYTQDYCLEIIKAQKDTDVVPLECSIVANCTKIIFSIFDKVLKVVKRSDEEMALELEAYEKEMDKFLKKVENYSDESDGAKEKLLAYKKTIDEKTNDTVKNIYEYTQKINAYKLNIEEVSNKQPLNLALTNASALQDLSKTALSYKCIEQVLTYFKSTLSDEALKGTN